MLHFFVMVCLNIYTYLFCYSAGLLLSDSLKADDFFSF